MTAKQNNDLFVKTLISITMGCFILIGFFLSRILDQFDRQQEKIEIMQVDVLQINNKVNTLMKAQGLPIEENKKTVTYKHTRQ